MTAVNLSIMNHQVPNRFDQRVNDFCRGGGYLALAITSLFTLSLSYQTETCKTEPLSDYGVTALGMNCPTVSSSLAVNLGLPVIAFAASIRAMQSFQRAFS